MWTEDGNCIPHFAIKCNAVQHKSTIQFKNEKKKDKKKDDYDEILLIWQAQK